MKHLTLITLLSALPAHSFAHLLDQKCVPGKTPPKETSKLEVKAGSQVITKDKDKKDGFTFNLLETYLDHDCKKEIKQVEFGKVDPSDFRFASARPDSDPSSRYFSSTRNSFSSFAKIEEEQEMPLAGGPPLLTDDPGTPGPNAWEVNIAFTAEHNRRSKSTSFEAPLLDINYGVGERIQLKYEVPYLVNCSADDSGKYNSVSGLGNSEFGVKFRFLDEDKNGIGMSIYPQYSVNSNHRSVTKGLEKPGTTFLMPVEIAKSWGKFSLGAEFGYEFNSKSPDELLFGLADGYNITETVQILAEFHGTSLKDFTDREFIVDIGARCEMSKHSSLLVSFGRGLSGDPKESPDYVAYLAWQLRF